MNAIDFVKKFGIAKVKGIVFTMTSGFINYDGISVNYDDLKQIVDAFELVESVGGWNNATALYDECLDTDLKKAIELMEKCQ